MSRATGCGWRSSMMKLFLLMLVFPLTVYRRLRANAAAKDNQWMVDELIPSLPRYDLKGRIISSDLSKYIHFNCTGHGKGRSCDLDQSNMKVSSMQTSSTTSENGSIQSYGTGVALYAVISFIAGVLIILLTFLYLLGLIIQCVLRALCCPKKTERNKRLENTKRTTTMLTMSGVTLTVLFCAVLIVTIILAYKLGMEVAFDGVSEFADAPYGVAQITYGTSLAAQPALIGMVSSALLPALYSLNATLCAAVRWGPILDDLRALNTSIGQLPNLDSLRNILLNVDNTTSAISGKLDGVFVFADTFKAQKNNISIATDVIISDMRLLNQTLETVNNASARGYDSVERFNEHVAELFGADGPRSYSEDDRDGYVDSVQYDFHRTQRNNTPGEGIPESDTLYDAATGPSASMARLLSGDLNGDVAETAQLITKLQSIYVSVRWMPNFALTASNLTAINDTVTAMLAPDGEVTLLPRQLKEIENAVRALPQPEVVKGHVQAMVNAVTAIDTGPLVSLLRATDTLIQSIPAEIEAIRTAITQVSAVIVTVRPLLSRLILDYPQSFNRTVMEIPENTTEVYTKITVALNKASNAADDVVPTLNDLNNTIARKVNITSFIDKITEAQSEYDRQVGIVNQTELNRLMDDSIARLNSTNTNTSSFDASVKNARQALQNVFIPPHLVEGFIVLEEVRYELEIALLRLVGQEGQVGSDGQVNTRTGDYHLLVQGVCSDDGLTYCSSDAECSPALCLSMAGYRCAASGSFSTPCTLDDQCPDGSFCLADFERAGRLYLALQALADPAVSDLGQDEVSAELEDVRETAQETDTEEFKTKINDIRSTLANVSTAIYEDRLLELKAQLNSSKLDIDSYLDDLRDAQQQVNDVDISEYTDKLNDARDKKKEYGDRLGDAITFTDDLLAYLFGDHALGARLDGLQKDHLDAVLDSDGFGPVLMAVGSTIEDTADDAINILRNNSFKQKRIEMTKDLRDPARYMDRFTANPHRGFFDLYEVGALYYMMQLTNTTAQRTVNADDPTADTVIADQNGNAYSNNRYCLTRTCFENQQDDLESSYGVYMPLLLVPLVLVVLVALCNIGCVVIPAKSGGCCRRCMPHSMLCMIILILPWYLIFSGLFFSWLIALSDGCTSGPKIAANYITAYGDDLCIRLEGKGTLNECTVVGNDLHVTLNLQRMTNVALGLESCPAKEDGDPFAEPLHSLAAQLRNASYEKATTEISKKRFRKFRPGIRSIATTLAVDSAEVMQEFLYYVGDDVITCENVQAVVEYFTSPICYSVVGPWTWLFSMLYLAAWSMCCLGIPAGCALKYSFRYQYEAIVLAEEAVNDRNDAMLRRISLARKGRVHGWLGGVLAPTTRSHGPPDAPLCACTEVGVEGDTALQEDAKERDVEDMHREEEASGPDVPGVAGIVDNSFSEQEWLLRSEQSIEPPTYDDGRTSPRGEPDRDAWRRAGRDLSIRIPDAVMESNSVRLPTKSPVAAALDQIVRLGSTKSVKSNDERW